MTATLTEESTDLCTCGHPRYEHGEHGLYCHHQFERTSRSARNAPDRCPCTQFEFRKAA